MEIYYVGDEAALSDTYKSLRKQYKKLSLKLHPDKQIDEKEKYQILFNNMKNSYNILIFYYKKKGWDN